jgi:uncharacterized protein (TIGR00661 family)
MPIIDELLRQGAEVILASDGAALALLKEEYPQLKTYELPAYDIRYPFSNMLISIGLQMPKILRGGIAEYIWLKNFLKDNPIDIVISDNRYGFFNKKALSIFITHQVNIFIPFKILKVIVNSINRFFIKKFDRLWIPDFENTPNLAGLLSDSHLLKNMKINYLGALSRMCYFNVNKKYKAIFVLSGPEPQRTYFEDIILKQLTTYTPNKIAKFCLVRGVTDAGAPVLNNQNENIDIYNFLTANVLNEKIMESELLISRSGYSTVMDLVKLKVPAVLVPTPGQTEQDYLASQLEKGGFFYTENQKDFSLERSLTEWRYYKGFSNVFFEKNDSLPEIIRELLKF